MKNKSVFAFTLAEVLITLTIVGVIAALTIPTLMAKYEIHKYETALKKTYSVLSNGFNMILRDYGDYSMFNGKGSSDPEFQANMDKILPNYFKIVSICKNDKCSSKQIKWLKGNLSRYRTPEYGVILEDGIYFDIENIYKEIPSIFIDTNGAQPPNTYGKDHFLLGRINSQGLIYPDASITWAKEIKKNPKPESDGNYWRNNPSHCGKPGVKLKDDPTSNIVGQNCLARIIENGWKIDYLP